MIKNRIYKIESLLIYKSLYMHFTRQMEYKNILSHLENESTEVHKLILLISFFH